VIAGVVAAVTLLLFAGVTIAASGMLLVLRSRRSGARV
jgi:hypothetical protein